MSFNLDIDLAIGSCCDQVEFCDTTCIFDPAAPINCCDGYGVDSNTTRYDVGSTAFHWVFPDGTIYQNVDVGYVPPRSARNSFTVTAGTEGGIYVKVNGVALGGALYSTNLVDMLNDLVVQINGASSVSGWVATYDSSTGVITVTSTTPGTLYNNLIVDVFVSGDITVTQTTQYTADGTLTEDDNCYTFNISDLAGSTCPDGYPKFPDGVHSMTYIIYDNDGEEISRVTKQFFFDCNVKACYKKLLLTIAHDCSCKDDNTAWKIAEIRNKIDAANEMFCEGDYDCANDFILEAGRMCKDFCLDC